MIVVFTRAHIPENLQQAWLQHLRDFDVANPDCHFEVMIDGSDNTPLVEMVERLRVTPGLTFSKIVQRETEVNHGPEKGSAKN